MNNKYTEEYTKAIKKKNSIDTSQLDRLLSQPIQEGELSIIVVIKGEGKSTIGINNYEHIQKNLPLFQI